MRAPYRNDHDAFMSRLVGLLDDLDALRSRARDRRDVDRETKRVEREIARLRKEIERVAPARLPLLDRVSIASPCSADWEAMTGDERSRHCAQCDKQVYDVASMTAEEAEDFLRAKAGDACLRLYRRADGTVLTADCPVGAQRKRRRRRVASLLGGGLVAAGALVAGARLRPPDPEVPVPSLAQTGAVTPPDAPATAEVRPEPSASPRRMPLAGKPAPPSSETLVEAEMAQVRRLLEQHANVRDPKELRAVEGELRAARERIAGMSKEAGKR